MIPVRICSRQLSILLECALAHAICEATTAPQRKTTFLVALLAHLESKASHEVREQRTLRDSVIGQEGRTSGTSEHFPTETMMTMMMMLRRVGVVAVAVVGASSSAIDSSRGFVDAIAVKRRGSDRTRLPLLGAFFAGGIKACTLIPAAPHFIAATATLGVVYGTLVAANGIKNGIQRALEDRVPRKTLRPTRSTSTPTNTSQQDFGRSGRRGIPTDSDPPLSSC